MDLAVRASLKGWKFVFIGDLLVTTERFQFHKLWYHMTQQQEVNTKSN